MKESIDLSRDKIARIVEALEEARTARYKQQSADAQKISERYDYYKKLHHPHEWDFTRCHLEASVDVVMGILREPCQERS